MIRLLRDDTIQLRCGEIRRSSCALVQYCSEDINECVGYRGRALLSRSARKSYHFWTLSGYLWRRVRTTVDHLYVDVRFGQ